MRRSRFGINMMSVLTVLFVIGCANQPHNDVLVFGTNTKFGVDVSSEPANAGTPTLTLGFKRQEVAWVPLKANGDLTADEKKKYQGTADGKKVDTYSVFASFGGGVTAGSETSAGLSQFFATGIAAQNLGENSAAANMVSVQPVNAEVLQKQEEISSLHKALGEEKVKTIKMEQDKVTSDRQTKAAVVVMSVAKDDGTVDATLLNKAIKDGNVKSPWDVELPKITAAKKLNSYLVDHVEDETVNSLYEQLK